jgi:DNA-binding GntR family transcriptional regulator
MIQDGQAFADPLVEAAPPVFQTAEEYAYQSLRGLILAGKLRGGARLNQDELARRLNVSRTPIRQAVLRLTNEGLVVNRPNRGAIVTTLGPAAVLELFEMRSVLEGLAFGLAIPNIDARAVAELEKRLDTLERAHTNITRWIQLHDDFHALLFQHSRRPRLLAQVHRLRQSVAPYLRLYLATKKIAEMPGNEHRSMIEAIRTGDVLAAEQMMREHVMYAAHEVVEFVRAQDEDGEGGGA